MISTRLALLRQAQEYFHQYLLGVINWDDVIVDRPIPVPPVQGHRDQGKFKDVVIAHFNGFKMEMYGPFEVESWPQGRVIIMHGSQEHDGPLDAKTWGEIADFIKRQKLTGDDDGTDATAGEAWGR